MCYNFVSKAIYGKTYFKKNRRKARWAFPLCAETGRAEAHPDKKSAGGAYRPRYTTREKTAAIKVRADQLE
jgi:hypothetical protein